MTDRCARCHAELQTCPVCGSKFPLPKKRCEKCRFSQKANKGSRTWNVRCRIKATNVNAWDSCEAYQAKKK
jgi:hypothetical protein